MVYFKIASITGQKELTREQLEEMVYFILSTGQVELSEIPYLFGYDEVKDSSKFVSYLRTKVRHSAFRIARYLFGEDNVVSIKRSVKKWKNMN